jgi:tetratricopeptide (TPR) repeat protein
MISVVEGSPSNRARSARLLGALGLLALVLGLYGPALPHQPLALDEACRVSAAAPASTLPAESTWLLRAPASAFAPAVRFSHRQDETVWGNTPFGRRLHAVLMHTATALLLFLALCLLGGHTGAAWLGAALFALNPFTLPAVFWLGARDLALGSGFCAAALAFYPGYAARPTPFRFLLWTIPALLAPLAHPAFALLPLLLRGLDARPLHRRGRLWLEKLPVLALAAVVLFLNAQHASAIAGPAGALVADQGWRWARLLYAPSLLLAGALALFLAQPGRFGGAPRGFRLSVAAGVLAVSLALTAAARAGWQSDELFWNAALRQRPTHATARLVVGHDLAARGLAAAAEVQYAALGARRAAWADAYARAGAADPAHTIAYLQTAIRLAPADAALHRNLGEVRAAAGFWDDAFTNYVAALKLNPRDPGALNGLGEVLVQRGRAAEAVDLFQEALARQPEDARIQANLERARAARAQAGN